MPRLLRLTPLLLAGGLTGWAGPAAAIQLNATLVSPLDIELKWKDPVAGAAGHIVEWTTDPKEGYTILAFLPPDQAAFKHPDLMPDTTCFYRIRAYYGPATRPVEISLSKELSDAAYVEAYAKPEDYSWAVPRTIPDGTALAKKSIRDAATAAEGGPTNLKIALVPTTVSGFKLTWTDHASDEEGYLIEIKPAGSPDFTVCAVVEPKINSFGWAFEPPVRKAALRVRAFCYGPPSNLVRLVTGPAPAQKPPETKPGAPARSAD